MYLNMMKKGIVLMTFFCGIGFIAAFFNIELLLFLLPVVWFLNFFVGKQKGQPKK